MQIAFNEPYDQLPNEGVFLVALQNLAFQDTCTTNGSTGINYQETQAEERFVNHYRDIPKC